MLGFAVTGIALVVVTDKAPWRLVLAVAVAVVLLVAVVWVRQYVLMINTGRAIEVPAADLGVRIGASGVDSAPGALQADPPAVGRVVCAVREGVAAGPGARSLMAPDTGLDLGERRDR